MEKILSFILSFFIFNSFFYIAAEQNIKSGQSLVSQSYNSKNSLLSSIANYFLFFGTKDDMKHLKHLNKKFEIKELNINWKSKKIHGYTLQPKNKKYHKVCICFGSDIFPCHRMVTEDIDDSILYVCIDYPGFGKSEYIRMDECKLTEFADMVYDYVSEHYKDNDLIAFGFSLGGFGASLMCSKEKVKKVVIISPVYLTGMFFGVFSESISKYLVNFLWGYELNSLKNVFECNRICDISLYSGDDKDFLSLYKTLSFYFRSQLKNEKGNEQKLEKIKSIIRNYENLNINISIYKNSWHHKIHPMVIKKNKDLFSLYEEELNGNLDAA